MTTCPSSTHASLTLAGRFVVLLLCRSPADRLCAAGNDKAWLQFYGLNSPDDDVVFFGDKSSKKFGSYWVRDGKVVAAFSEGGSNEENAGIKKVAEQQPKAPSDLAKQGFAFASKL